MHTLTKLSSAIKKARADGFITEAEVSEIVKATGKSVSNHEAKTIGALFESRAATDSPPFPGFPPPLGTPDRPLIVGAASQAFNSLFVTRNLPFGDRANAMRDEINDFLSVSLLAPPSEKRPNINHLPTLDLQPGLFDAPHMTAHIDVTKKQMWLSQSGGGLLPPGVPVPKARYWGPFALPTPTPAADQAAGAGTARTNVIRKIGQHFRDVGAHTGSAERFGQLLVSGAGPTREEQARAIVKAAGFEGASHQSSPGLQPFVSEIESLGHETESPAYPRFLALVRRHLENLQTITVDALILLAGTDKETGQLVGFVIDGR